jgi:membrane protease YdiL (CAAX protease family)
MSGLPDFAPEPEDSRYDSENSPAGSPVVENRALDRHAPEIELHSIDAEEIRAQDMEFKVDRTVTPSTFAPEPTRRDQPVLAVSVTVPDRDLIPPGEEPPSEPLLAWYSQPDIEPPARIPHMGHVLLLCLLAIIGLLGAGALTQGAIHLHLLGISSVKQAVDDVRYTLGSQAAFYLTTFIGCLIVFPPVWGKGFFAGIQWRAATALRLRWRLAGAAFLCFILAIANGILLPGPPDTPIDRIFRIPGAAWLLFGFGVTLAPFFEEMAFRGFLLPAICTAFDWASEHFSGNRPRWPDINGHPRWSLSAMVVASVLTSIPFALMHAEQTGYSLGPFLLLVCVSFILCWIRLSTRSLASSVLVHSCYNFLLFSIMLAGTGGFKHLDKM